MAGDRDPLRISTDPFPFGIVHREQPHHLRDQLGGRLVPRDEQLLSDPNQLRHLDRPTVSAVFGIHTGVEQRGQQIIPRLDPALLELVDEELLHFEGDPGVLDVLIVRNAGPDGRGTGIGPTTEVAMMLGRQVQHLGDDVHGERDAELRDEFYRGRVVPGIDE